MPSLVRRGTAWEATLVKVITADYPPTFDVGPLPGCLTALMLARCDPNIIGNPSLSPLGTAIRRGEERTVEVLLQFQADPHLKEAREEQPLIIAIARRATNCVKLLLEYRRTHALQCLLLCQDPTGSLPATIDAQQPWKSQPPTLLPQILWRLWIENTIQ